MEMYTVEEKAYELELTSEACTTDQLLQDNESHWYEAYAEDKDGNKYKLYWYILDGFKDGDLEEFACDWDNPFKIEMV